MWTMRKSSFQTMRNTIPSLKNEKAKLKSDLEKKKKKIELKPVNYMILDPICTTFDPEESLKQ